jgi:hypothetical protein
MLKWIFASPIGKGSHLEIINEYATNSHTWKRINIFHCLNVMGNIRILDHRDDSCLNSLKKVFKSKAKWQKDLSLFLYFLVFSWKYLNMLKCVEAFIEKKFEKSLSTKSQGLLEKISFWKIDFFWFYLNVLFFIFRW